MLLNVKLDLGYGDWKPENDWPGLCAVWPLAEDPQKPPRHCWDVKAGPCRMTSEEVQILVEFCTIHEFSVKLLPLPGMQIVKTKDERKWSHGETVQPVDLQSGAAVQITVADMALLMINEVTWLDDCCTEELQVKLDEGWRILAVCPPNAQRRPDYILGRRK